MSLLSRDGWGLFQGPHRLNDMCLSSEAGTQDRHTHKFKREHKGIDEQK